MITWDAYARLEREDSERVSVKLAYVDMAADLNAGVLLSQIVYWHLPTRDGGSKLRVFHEGEYWIAKSRSQWWAEIRLSPRQVDRARARLVERELVITKVFKFKGAPTTHLRLNTARFLQDWAVLNSPNGENGHPQTVSSISRPGDMDVPETVRSLTDTTAEITSNITRPSANKSRFPPAWYRQIEKDYPRIKGIQLSGPEFGPLRKDLKMIYEAGHSPDDVRAFAEALEASEEAWTSLWTIKTVRMKMAEFKAGKLFKGNNSSLTACTNSIDSNWCTKHGIADEATRDVWNAVSEAIKAELSPTSFETWFIQVAPVSMANGTFVLATADAFTKGGLERRFKKRIEELLTDQCGHKTVLEVLV